MRALYASSLLAVISSLDFGSCKDRANFLPPANSAIWPKGISGPVNVHPLCWLHWKHRRI